MTDRAGPDKGPGVGSLLRASRLRIGEDLHDVAAALYIRYSYLNAIEEGRYEALPGSTYAVGFVRVYAEHLGLDSTEVVRRFKAETAALSETRELVFPSPLPESGIPSGAILFIGVVIAGLAYGAWYITTAHNKSIADLIPALPERFAALLDKGAGQPANGGEAESATTAKAEPAAPDSSTAPAASAETAGSGNGASAPPAPSEPVEAASATPPETPPASESASPVATPQGTASGADGSPAEAQPASEAAREPAPPPTAETPQTAEKREPSPTVTANTDEPTPSTAAASGQAASENAPTPAPEPSDAATTSAEALESPPPPPPPTQEISGLTRNDNAAGASAATTSSEAARDAANATAQTAVATVASAGAAPVEGAAAPSSPASPDGGGRIVVRAKSASWIQVRDDVAKQLLMTRLMQPGDTYKVPDRPGLKLLTGNAGALEILVDGAAVPAIGPVGAVRRDVALDIERLKNGTAAEN